MRKIVRIHIIIYCVGVLLSFFACSPAEDTPEVRAARPWVFWYWMQASVSREGITADLEAMKAAGIGGAYLMPIKGPATPPLMDPPVVQLTPAWWAMVKHACKEARRLGLQIGMHDCDGFAVAGGPWVKPEQSMQKVVWADIQVAGGVTIDTMLSQPETNEGYYQDIGVFAYPTSPGQEVSTHTVTPTVTTSVAGATAQFLVDEDNTTESFRSKEPCWIQYQFDEPFICRSVTVRVAGSNFQAQRLTVEASDDGRHFAFIARLDPPRQGWQNNDADITYAIRPARARYYRFVFDPRGTEPGAEDLDAAKWKPDLKVRGITLSATPKIHQYEGKNGSVWRVGKPTTSIQVSADACVKEDQIINLSSFMNYEGHLVWNAPPGHWTILRMGHTSTGHTNYTGGGGLGLECDKFSKDAAHRQFDQWFGEATRRIGPSLAADVLTTFHVDSWECGSQNWSLLFRDEFLKRRGYDLFPYLPVMAGVPIESPDVSERVLADVRQTITELVRDNFYGTLARLAHEKGCTFTAEAVAPTMMSDGMMHYGQVDVPMGEFWWHSPTHDKPNDMLDAISAAHVYGKNIVQAEAFTTVRMAWDEHPGMLKALGDRQYALGVNKLVYHVFTHNPWLDQQPGMTLDGVGLYFQRDQTWWKPGRAWVDYALRCQLLLQQGMPVVDVAVFTGEETPRRAILPERLTTTLPGLIGAERLQQEQQRLANKDQPLREIPDGVWASAHITDPQDWLDPLQGYAFDSFNRDALLRLAKVRNGRIEVPGGMSYALLVIPGARPLAPDPKAMSEAVAKRLIELVTAGATVMITNIPDHTPGLQGYPQSDVALNKLLMPFREGYDTLAGGVLRKKIGKGQVIKGPYKAASFKPLGIMPDVIATEADGHRAANLDWTHRSTVAHEIYFITNQSPTPRSLTLSLRTKEREPELYDPVTDITTKATYWHVEDDRTLMPITLPPHGSLFIKLGRATFVKRVAEGPNQPEPVKVKKIEAPWLVQFDAQRGGPAQAVTFPFLQDWCLHADTTIRYYAGTAQYTTSFDWKPSPTYGRIWLDLGEVANLAEVTLNGTHCGVAWTPPYRVNITDAIQEGHNELTVAVTNTWANRLIGDHRLPEAQRITHTTAPFRLQDKPLVPAGLLGPVTISVHVKK